MTHRPDRNKGTPMTVDEYIAGFPPDVQADLQRIRETIREVAPEAGEKIAYGIPTFTFHGNLVHYAAFEHHYGLYPGSGPVEQLADELAGYETSKGTIRLPRDRPLPLDLIRKVVRAAVERNTAKRR
jgi:uncharacterized protein YdhG (YjbR/CyaY superfamily)